MAIAHRRVQKGGFEIEPSKHRGATELNDSDEFRAAGGPDFSTLESAAPRAHDGTGAL
jgi:hypothetical protein